MATRKPTAKDGSKRGGQRMGAGRPAKHEGRGSEEVDETGQLTPVGIMMDNMRWYERQAVRNENLYHKANSKIKKRKHMQAMLKFKTLAQGAAKDVAQFKHAKLANTEMTGKGGGPVKMDISVTFVKPTNKGIKK